ncbi:MAG: Stp1/IreP family PP2C-type Ser/Thr phosphatase [Clostridiales bacterium]|nr:Stp1/IreP family PP2C-type Ser/Thr phosphatase [Candidatus Coliplasma caballi]
MKVLGKTDVGSKRKNNQDAYEVVSKPDYTLAVVCDGMGGASGGKLASSTAVRSFCSTIRTALADNPSLLDSPQEIEDLLRQAVEDANTDVYRKAAEDSDLDGMGTTLVAVLLCDVGDFAVNVGDSRLYRKQGGELIQVTKDNSFIQYLLDKGLVTPEEAKTHPNRNIILRALGVNEEVEIDLYRIDGYEQLLLCSDGLYNMVPKEEMLSVLDGTYTNKKHTPSMRVRVNELIRRANKNGGQDNITAIVIGEND